MPDGFMPAMSKRVVSPTLVTLTNDIVLVVCAQCTDGWRAAQEVCSWYKEYSCAHLCYVPRYPLWQHATSTPCTAPWFVVWNDHSVYRQLV
jgi:hypothetical protein